MILRTVLSLAVMGVAIAGHAQETLPERELRRVVERERVLLKATADNPMGIDRENVQMQLQEVVQDYERIIRDNPQFAPAFVAYGLLLSKVGERKRAAEVFLSANKIDSGIAVVKNQLGNYCAEEGEFRDAMEYYLAAIALEPNEPLYHYQLGSLLHEYRDEFVHSGRLDMPTVKRQSAAAFRKAAELAPDSIPYAYRQAESYYDFEMPDWSRAPVAWRRLRERVTPGVEQQTIDPHIAQVLIMQEKFDDPRVRAPRIDRSLLREKPSDFGWPAAENPGNSA